MTRYLPLLLMLAACGSDRIVTSSTLDDASTADGTAYDEAGYPIYKSTEQSECEDPTVCGPEVRVEIIAHVSKPFPICAKWIDSVIYGLQQVACAHCAPSCPEGSTLQMRAKEVSYDPGYTYTIQCEESVSSSVSKPTCNYAPGDGGAS